MVNAQFGLRDNPFRLTPDLGVRCDWASFTTTRERLAVALREGGKHVLIGEPGVGKTLLLRSLAQELAPLGAAYAVCGRHFAVADLERALGAASPAVLLLDDAHHLEAAALEELLARDGALALGAIPGFAAHDLDSSVLAPLLAEEIAPYVHCRLAAAGWSGGELFDASACARLWSFSQGAPRRVNNLCSAALFLASQRGASRVDAELIEAAAAGLSLQLAPAPPSPQPSPRRRASPPAAPSGEAPTIMAAFMRERAAATTPERNVRPPTAQPAEDAPPGPKAAEGAAPAAESATLLRRTEAGRAGRPLEAPAVERWNDEPGTERAPPPPRRRAWLLMPALGLAILAGLGVAWNFEFAPKPDLGIEWSRVQAVTSPHVDLAVASEGSALASAVRETAPDGAIGGPPIVFPYAPAPPPPPPPAPTPEPVEPAAEAVGPPAASPAPPLISASAPPAAPPAAVDAPPADALPEPAPPASAAPSTQVAAVPDAPAPPPVAPPQTAPDEAPEPASAESDKEARIAELLAQARRLALAFALTTPAGQSAYDSYQQVLALEPGRREALAGLDEIAAKYDDLAGLARLREKPALVQLYENRAAQVRRDRARHGGDAASSPSAR